MISMLNLKAMLEGAVRQPMERQWACNTDIDEHIQALKARLGEGEARSIQTSQQEAAIRRFLASSMIPNLKDAKLISHGLLLRATPEHAPLIEDERRFPIVLNAVDNYRSWPQKYRRCYEGLLNGYFGYDADQGAEVGVANWNVLRDYLQSRVGNTIGDGVAPAWGELLQEHKNLLSNDPCNRYGDAVLYGETEEVDEIRRAFRISNNSWFMRELIMAQLDHATLKDDTEFLDLVPQLLDLVQLDDYIADESLALLLDRYALVSERPLNELLRNMAVSMWSTPWLPSNSMRWGRVTEDAKQMVTEWLKLEFIDAFFSLLAEERTGDMRRLNFWRRYVKAIDTMNFALGGDARTSRTPDYVALRKKILGLSVALEDPVKSNNAFIMHMGPVIIVEFGAPSNACYGYAASKSLPFDLSRSVVIPVDKDNSLKRSDHELKWVHQDGIHGWSTWEEMFEASLREHYGICPGQEIGRTVCTRRRPQDDQRSVETNENRSTNSGSTRSPGSNGRSTASGTQRDVAALKDEPFSRQALLRLAAIHKFLIDDLTERNGNLWVRTNAYNKDVNRVLTRWGFKYKPAKGWWRKG